MSNRTRLVIVAAVAAVIVVVPLAFLIPGQTGTQLVATLAFVVALGKATYDVWDKERERTKKSDETREKVKAIARFGHWDSTGQELGVLLYNESSVTPVHIRSVVCHYKTANGQTEQSLELSNLKHRTEELLPPKYATKFRDGGFKTPILKMLAALPDDQLWISVTSYQGEVCRVDGSEIKAVLNSPPTNQVNS
jgi:hypothetical protein